MPLSTAGKTIRTIGYTISTNVTAASAHVWAERWRSRASTRADQNRQNCAPLAGDGAYCSRSVICFLLPALQLRQLNEIAAGVVHHGDLGSCHVGWWHGEHGAARFHALVIGLHIVGEEHGRGLVLLEQGLLVRFGRRVVVQRQLQLSAVRVLGRGHGQPAKWAVTEIGFLGKAQYLRVEAQGLVLVIHVYAGQFDFHSFLLCHGRGLGRVVFSLVFLFVGVD